MSNFVELSIWNLKWLQIHCRMSSRTVGWCCCCCLPPPLFQTISYSRFVEIAEPYANMSAERTGSSASPLSSVASITPHTTGESGASPEHNAENCWWEASAEQTNLLSTDRIIKASQKCVSMPFAALTLSEQEVVCCPDNAEKSRARQQDCRQHFRNHGSGFPLTVQKHKVDWSL